MKQADTKALAIIQKVAHPLAEAASNFKIVDGDDMKEATAMLSDLNKQRDRVTEEKEKVTKPLNQALKAERARWKPLEDVLEGAIDALRRRMTSYQTQAKAEADAKADRIAARVGEGKGKLAPETAMRKLDEIEKPEEAVSTDAGQVKFRTVEKFEVIEISKLPWEYLTPNETKIREAMKAGLKLPGVRYYTEEVPMNFR
jgi:hypothetical protein